MDKALTEATANYNAFVQDLKLKLEKEVKVWNSLFLYMGNMIKFSF